ncbi:MAG: hypothetical protein NTY19_32360, partial [Planctomycetota bacterium]|nr:hypothetical protein [Planctomycetota bacterium]
MITLTRPLARQVRAVFRHALGTSPRGPCPAVSLRADQRGLTIRLKSGMTAIERSVPGEYSDGKQILVGRRSVLGRSGAPTMAESSDGLGSVGKGPLWPTLQGRSDQVVSI